MEPHEFRMVGLLEVTVLADRTATDDFGGSIRVEEEEFLWSAAEIRLQDSRV